MKKISIFLLAMVMLQVGVTGVDKNTRDKNILCEVEYVVQEVNV